MKDNMIIWGQVDKTDPKYTKWVNQRGGFTAIDQIYQVRMATEIFGPIGYGWGVKDETFNVIGDMVLYQAILFYRFGDPEVINEIPIHSGLKVKPDCIKSVATDALTKGLSKLGFNADVFLGRFDDNRYVESMKKEFDNKNDDDVIIKDDGSSVPQKQSNGNADFAKKISGDQKQVADVMNQAKSKLSNGNGTGMGNGAGLKDGFCNFKKHKGKKWSEVALVPKVGRESSGLEYMNWLIDNIDDLDDNTRAILNQYVG